LITGSWTAPNRRALAELEAALNGEILAELQQELVFPDAA
jgi:hypothetical protein